MNQEVRNHIIKSLDANVRIDGRNPQQHRDVTVETGVIDTAEGSARVTAGNAEVLAGVKVELREPYPDTPDAGSIMVNVELLPLSSPEFEGGRPGIESIEPSRVIDRGIRESGSVDLKNLCIKKGEQVYNLAIDIVPINYDGNIVGLGGLAAIAALKTVEFPTIEDGKLDYHEPSGNTLEINEEPIPVTVFKVDDHFVIDPTSEEEKASNAHVTITVLEGDRVCSLQKGGSTPLSFDDLNKMIDLAFEHGDKLREHL